MGYCMTQRDCNFFIGKQAQVANFKKMRQELIKNAKQNGSYSGYDWVDLDSIKRAKTIADILTAFRWLPELDCEGNIIRVSFEGEKSGDEDTLFNILAPIVKNGSFIEMDGEDGAVWRWTFKNKKCDMKDAKIFFGEEESRNDRRVKAVQSYLREKIKLFEDKPVFKGDKIVSGVLHEVSRILKSTK